MPNTRADLERLKAERWAVGPGGPRAGVYVELLAMAEQLMSDKEQLMQKLGAARMDTHQAILERDESIQETRYCHGAQLRANDLAAKLLLEIGRLRTGIDDARDQSRMAAKDAATNAGNMCEDEPYAAQVWRRWEEQAEELQTSLTALLNPEGSTAPPHLTCIRCGQTFPEHELSAHLATCE